MCMRALVISKVLRKRTLMGSHDTVSCSEIGINMYKGVRLAAAVPWGHGAARACRSGGHMCPHQSVSICQGSSAPTYGVHRKKKVNKRTYLTAGRCSVEIVCLGRGVRMLSLPPPWRPKRELNMQYILELQLAKTTVIRWPGAPPFALLHKWQG